MRFDLRKVCFTAVAMALLAPSMALAAKNNEPEYVETMDAQLNGAIEENNRLISELLYENQNLASLTKRLLETLGDGYNDFSLGDIKYPTDLLAPKILEKLGLGNDVKPTMLKSPFSVEVFVENYFTLNQQDMRSKENGGLTDKEFEDKYGYTKVMWAESTKNRRTIASREALLEGYGIAYAARMKAAATGDFIQNELRKRARDSVSIKDDLDVENLALAEIVGQLGTLVAVAAASLEIDSITSLNASDK